MKKKKYTFDDILEIAYYFLKNKLKFDDIQAVTFLASIILIPISILLGFSSSKIETFQISLYITLGLDIIVVAYSIIKYKYFRDKRINFIEKMENKSIEVKNIDDVNNLDPIEFEYFVQEFFIRKGYKAITTKKSNDKGADVIAEKGSERIAIQVKHSLKPISVNAIYETIEGKSSYRADKAILFTNSELTYKAENCAMRNEIEVIYNHDISQFLRKNPSIKFRIKK